MKVIQKAGERGIAIYITAFLLVITIPMMGLAFDGTMLFIIKARLQGAVDGAALAGARALARGADSASQTASAQTTAEDYVNLNYPASYFFSNTVTVTTPTVDLSVTNQRTVTVNASVVFPAFFMRIINASNTTINAAASATRKDVNVVMVVDRSGSLAASGSCTPLMAAATNFVGQFASGRDEVGLVTFASSTYVNFPIANTFDTASPSVTTMINNITCAGSTSSAMGLWYGYDQLVGLNEPGALNVILFFTDGQPTGVAYAMPVLKTSPCSATTPGNPTGPGAYTLPSTAKGTITGLYNTFTSPSEFFGILLHTGTAGTGGEQSITNGDINPATNSTGCTYYSGWAYDGGTHNMTTTTDFAGVPNIDIFGSSSNTSYQAVTTNAAGLIDLSNASNAYNMALNAADSAATRIRTGVTDTFPNNYGRGLSNIIIFSIGLGNASIPASPTFLERVSNDTRSPIYDSSYPSGKYIYAATTADLQAAFAEVASEVLRLAK